MHKVFGTYLHSQSVTSLACLCARPGSLTRSTTVQPTPLRRNKAREMILPAPGARCPRIGVEETIERRYWAQGHCQRRNRTFIYTASSSSRPSPPGSPSVYPPVYLSVCMYVCLAVCPAMCRSVVVCLFPSVYFCLCRGSPVSCNWVACHRRQLIIWMMSRSFFN